MSISFFGFGCYDDTKTEIQKEAMVENRTLCDGEGAGYGIYWCGQRYSNGECCITLCGLSTWNGCYVATEFITIGSPPSGLALISNGRATLCFTSVPYPFKIWVYCDGVTVTCKDFGGTEVNCN